MTDTTEKQHDRHWLHTLVRDYPWIHIGLGLAGNLAFVVGSVLFIWHSTKNIALALFIIGSSGMLLGSVGNALVKHEKAHHR